MNEFDVVIGNPPYVNFAILPQMKELFSRKLIKSVKIKQTCIPFVEKSTQILKSNAKFSFIIPYMG